MRKIGVSLAPAILLGQPQGADAKLVDEFDGLGSLLDWLGQAKVASVELRSVGATFAPEDLLESSRLLEANGLDMTVHGSLPKAVLDPAAAADFFHPYSLLWPGRGQKPLLIVLHALSDSAELTVTSLKNLLSYAAGQQLPVQLALENSRDKRHALVGVSCRGIADLVDEVSLPWIGSCWDMGHFYYNVINDTKEGRDLGHDPQALPPDYFLKMAVHTHIHGLVEGTTHFPVEPGINLPLARYCQGLDQAGYQGLYNLELGFDRYSKKTSPRAGLEMSLLALQER